MEIIGFFYIICWILLSPLVAGVWIAGKLWGLVKHFRWAQKAAWGAKRVGAWLSKIDTEWRM